MQQSSSTAVNVAPLNAVVDPLDCPVIVWEGVRVVTTDTLAKGYGTDESNIRKNHSRNNSRFIEGIHIFTVNVTNGAKLIHPSG